MSPFCPRLPTVWDFQHTPLARNDHNLGGFSNILPYAQDYPLVARQIQESHQIGSDFFFLSAKINILIKVPEVLCYKEAKTISLLVPQSDYMQSL